MSQVTLPTLVQHVRTLFLAQLQSECSERELLQRFCRERDEAAFTVLLKRHAGMVWNVCRRVLSQSDAAEDAFQATFLVLTQKAGSIRNGQSLASWLHRVAFNLACKAKLQAARREEQRKLTRNAACPNPADQVTWQEIRTIMDEELLNLSEKHRLPLILCYLEGLTQEEASLRLGWGKSTLRRRLERGRELLRTRLMRRGVTLSAGLLPMLLSEATAATVPVHLILGAVKAGLVFGHATTMAPVSTKAMALAHGMLHSMSMVKVKVAALAILLASVTLAGVGGLGMARPADELPAAQQEARVQAAQLVKKESERVDRYGDPLPAGVIARLGTVRFRHSCGVESIAFLPNGKELIAGYLMDGSIHVWNIDGKKIRTLVQPGEETGILSPMSVSPDGKNLMTSGNNNTLVRSLPDGKRRYRLDTENVFSIAWSSDSTKVATCGYDGITIWEVKTGKRLFHLPQMSSRFSCIAYAPNGKLLAWVGRQGFDARNSVASGTIRLFDLEQKKQIGELRGHHGCINDLEFSPDSSMLCSASSDDTVRIWDTKSSKEVARLEVQGGHDLRMQPFLSDVETFYPGGALRLAVSADGKLLASGCFNGLVQVWDLATRKRLCEFHGHCREITGLAFTPDSKSLASGSSDHSIRLWDLSTGKEIAFADTHGGHPTIVTISPDGQRIATVGTDKTIRFWDQKTTNQVAMFKEHEGMFTRVQFLPDGHRLVSHCFNDSQKRTFANQLWQSTIRIWDIQKGEASRSITSPNVLGGLAISPKGDTIASAYQFWEVATGKQIKELRDDDIRKSVVGGLQFTPNGKLLGMGLDLDSKDYEVAFVDVDSGKEVHRFKASSFANLPDGQRVLLRSSDGMIRLCDIRTGYVHFSFPLPGHNLWNGYDVGRNLVLSPDGRMFAWAAIGSTIEIWEVATGRLRKRFHGHQGPVKSLAFFPNGRRLVSVSEDTTGLIWNVIPSPEQPGGTAPLSGEVLQNLWSELASSDAAKAFDALTALIAHPAQATALFTKHLQPAKPADERAIADWIRDLNSDRFAVRSKAMRELQQFGQRVRPELEKALKTAPTLEMRQRLQQLVDGLSDISKSPEHIRQLRAIEALEYINTPEARRLLERLATGAPQALQTREARLAIARMR